MHDCGLFILSFQLTLVDTIGYGDQVNKEESFKPVVDYIDAQFEGYLQEELKIKRQLATFHDTRIHVCLYFICPTGHGYVLFGFENVPSSSGANDFFLPDSSPLIWCA